MINKDKETTDVVIARVVKPNEKMYTVKQEWTSVHLITEWLVLADSPEEAQRIAEDQNASPRYYCKLIKDEEKKFEGDYSVETIEAEHQLGEKK